MQILTLQELRVHFPVLSTSMPTAVCWHRMVRLEVWQRNTQHTHCMHLSRLYSIQQLSVTG
jgi:hypothetical protein